VNEPEFPDEDSATIRARRARIAFVISVIINLIGVALFWRLFALPREPAERSSPTEIVTFEKKRHVVPIVIHPRLARVPPKPRVHVKPIVALAPAPRSAAPHVRVQPQPPRAASRQAELAKNPGATRTPVHTDHTSPDSIASKRSQFSAQRIAQIESDLQGTIDAARGSHALLAVAPEAAPTMKHYATDLGDLTTGIVRGHGLCDPTKDWKAEGYDYYYVACNVKFSDGTFQRQDVPWPVRFNPNDDPFAGTARASKPLALPLPGWHLPPGETISDELRRYAHDQGVDL
jgi:hypothetical protein